MTPATPTGASAPFLPDVPDAIDERRLRRLRRVVLGWFRVTPRPLPWRDSRDPYAVLVSEVMLQQTQVGRVEPRWRAFLERFPDVASLAAASPAEVLSAWRGLGYNRRAVALHAAAVVICREHGGRVPDDLESLRALPGIGEYTARALLAFAFGRDVAPVDTNVARVLARAVAGRPLGPRAAQRLADGLVPPRQGRDWGYALMDLGARVCTARNPRCHACPLAAACAWLAAGGGPDPAAPSARARQPFAGSDRFHRGRLVDALRHRPLAPGDLPRAAGLDDGERLAAITAGLVDDGLAEWEDGWLRLPG